MTIHLLVGLIAFGITVFAQPANKEPKPAGANGYPDQPWKPVGYPKSTLFSGVEFDLATRRTAAPGSDIWPITWADDDHQYTAFGDGGGFGGNNNVGRVSMGVSHVEGDAGNYVGKNVWGGKDAENPAQFEGKGTGILSVNGTLYMWVAGPKSSTVPTTTLAVSRDHSRTWQLAPWQWTMRDRLCAGVFINAGRDYADAPDDFVYACFTRVEPVPPAPRTWIFERPGTIDLARAPKHRLEDRAAWEWFAGNDKTGVPRWTKDLNQRTATFEDPNGIKVVSVCYQPALQRYLIVYNPKDTLGHFALFESPQPWGPWSEVAYLKGQPLFLPPTEADQWRVSLFHFAPKWWSRDGREFTLLFNTGDDAWNTIRGRLK